MSNGVGKPITTFDVKARKGADKLVCLTAHSTPTARLIDEFCDIVLVGDSLGMVVHGLPSTVGVTLDMMLLHAKAVRRGLNRALMVVDLPFGSYESSRQTAFESAVRLMQETDCAAVKLEGGSAMAPTVRFLVSRGIPVMSHIGLTPQSINVFGGYKVQGRGAGGDSLLADARACEEAGAFAIVIEKVAEPVARRITGEVGIPTIGIGASPACDGQILVTEDILGLFREFRPKFAKRYRDFGSDMSEAIACFAKEVRDGDFPTEEHCFRE